MKQPDLVLTIQRGFVYVKSNHKKVTIRIDDYDSTEIECFSYEPENVPDSDK